MYLSIFLRIIVCILLMAEKQADQPREDIQELWVWGSDGYGRLGQGTVNQHQMKAVRVKGLENKLITSLACGSAHTILACHNPGDNEHIECYSWGKCHFGQLGHNELEIDESTPRLLTNPVLGDINKKVLLVGCGQSFSFLVTADGAYSWGCGYYGALGHGGEESLLKPKLIEGLKGCGSVKSITGGAFHSIAMTNKGRVYSWGRDHVGQLGLYPLSGTSKVRLNQKTPKEVELPMPPVKIDTFANHTMVLLEGGVLISFGDSSEGQLGHKMPSFNANKDLREGKKECRVEIKSDKNGEYLPILDMACGTFHSLAVTMDYKLYSWGSNALGALGRESVGDKPKPVDTDVLFKMVSAGHETSLALSRDNVVYSWGENYVSKLGRDTNTGRPGEVESLKEKKISGIICGENHCMAYV